MARPVEPPQELVRRRLGVEPEARVVDPRQAGA
jgi:hypothetical protein